MGTQKSPTMTRGRVRARPCLTLRPPLSDPSRPPLLTYHKDARARARGHAREMTPVRAFGPLFIHPRVYRRPAKSPEKRPKWPLFARQNGKKSEKKRKKGPKRAKKRCKKGSKGVRKVVPAMGRVRPRKSKGKQGKKGCKKGSKKGKKGSKNGKKGRKKCEKSAKKEQKRGGKWVKNG